MPATLPSNTAPTKPLKLSKKAQTKADKKEKKEKKKAPGPAPAPVTASVSKKERAEKKAKKNQEREKARTKQLPINEESSIESSPSSDESIPDKESPVIGVSCLLVDSAICLQTEESEDGMEAKIAIEVIQEAIFAVEPMPFPATPTAPAAAEKKEMGLWDRALHKMDKRTTAAATKVGALLGSIFGGCFGASL